MKISQIEIYKSPVKLIEPFVISLGLLEYAENILVIIRTDQGITGFGECSPFRTRFSAFFQNPDGDPKGFLGFTERRNFPRS